MEIEIHPIAFGYMGLEFRGEIWAGETYLEGIIHSVIHALNQCFLSTLCGPGTMLGAGQYSPYPMKLWSRFGKGCGWLQSVWTQIRFPVGCVCVCVAQDRP